MKPLIVISFFLTKVQLVENWRFSSWIFIKVFIKLFWDNVITPFDWVWRFNFKGNFTLSQLFLQKIENSVQDLLEESINTIYYTTNKKTTYISRWFVFLKNGGEGEIWTLGTVYRYSPLAGECIRPLCHFTVWRKIRDSNSEALRRRFSRPVPYQLG